MILVAVLIVTLCLYYFFCCQKYSTAKNVAVYQNYVPILGHTLEFTKDTFSLVKEMGYQATKNDGIVYVSVGLGLVPIYIISDPVKATVVLNTCLEKSFIYKLINPLFGDTLVSATGAVWKRNRRILDLAFKAQVLDGYMDVFNSQASKLLQAIDQNVGKGHVDVTNDITKNVLETTCQTTMGLLADNQTYVTEKYVQALHKVFEIITLRVQKIWLLPNFLFNMSSAKRQMDDALAVIVEVSSKMVALRKSEYFQRIKKNNNIKHIRPNHDKLVSYLDIVIENSMTDNGSLFTDEQLRYLTDNILLAGFDTTTYELLFTLVCIGSDDEVQRKIRQEIQDVLGDEEVVRKEHLQKLVYLEAAVKEAIRLYPIGPVVARHATEAVQLDNTTLPAGSEIVTHLWAINRNKTYWGPDAEEFNPGRWFSSTTLPQHPNAFGSFSFGRRNCIGKQYGMMLMKTTLVPILRKYRIKSDHTQLKFECYIMLKAKAGHFMKFEPC